MKDKKNIKLITFGNFPYGGASANFLRNFARSLSNFSNIEVWLPSGYYYGNFKNDKRAGFVEKVKYRYLGFINRPRNYFGKFIDDVLSYFLPLVYICKYSLVGKLDVIILYNIFFTKALSIIFCKFIVKKKIIVIFPEYYKKPQNFISLIRWYEFFLGINFLVKFIDGAIVLSEYLKNKIISIKKIPIFILPNIIDPETFNLKNVVPYKKDKITIGYCGTPTEKDGINDLLKSFSLVNKKYKNTHLLIIGDITNGKSVIPKLREESLKLGIEESVSYTGLVDSEDIPKLLHSVQILVLTRPKGEFAEAGFPTKLGEYFACKKPVLVTKVGDLKKYFENEKDLILTEPGDIESIVNGLIKLIENKSLQGKISLEGYKWMESNLNYKNLVNKLSKFIDFFV